MSYPFEDPESKFGDLVMSLAELSHTDTPFDAGFSARLPSGRAFGFDKVKDRVCAYRSPNAKQKLRSADAFLIGERDSEPWYYFIDFKNQKPDNIQSVKDPDLNELMQKAFDSLSILAMTFGRDVPMRQLQSHSTFIVVYPRQEYSLGFTQMLNQHPNGRPLWNLDRLTNGGFYAEVKTVHDGDFANLSLPYL